MSTPIANPPFYGFRPQLEQQQHAREDIVVEQVASAGDAAETIETPAVEVVVEQPKPAAEPAPAAPKPSDVPPKKPEDAVAQAGDDPAKLRALLVKANKEAAAARVNGSKAAQDAADKAKRETYDAIGKQLGFVADDEEPTVENLQAKLAEQQEEREREREEVKATKLENALLRFGPKHSANIDELTDSRAFKSKLDKIDLTADDWQSQVDDLVGETVTANPTKFRLVQVTQRSGAATPSGDAAATAATDDDNDEDPITRERKARAKVRDR